MIEQTSTVQVLNVYVSPQDGRVTTPEGYLSGDAADWPCRSENCYGMLTAPVADGVVRCVWCGARYRVERTDDGMRLYRLVPSVSEATDASSRGA